MQPLNAAPRDHLTVDQVTALLRAAVLEVDYGVELLAPDLTYVEDISADVAGGSIHRTNHAKIHGTCDLQLGRDLTWGVDLVKPYMTLTDDAVTARFDLGVFCLTTPERTIGEDPATRQVQGYDRLMLLDREVGADYTVTAGTTYWQALADVFGDAGLSGFLIDGAALDDTLPADRVWPLVPHDTADPDQTDTPATWLRIVNDLLLAINFRAVWADQSGQYRCVAYQDPTSRAAEFTFDADNDATTIVGLDRTVVEDVWATPNRWVFIQSPRPDGAPAPTEGDGIYTVVNQSDGPTSIDGRGLEWPTVISYEAPSQAKLVDLGDRRVAADRRITSTIQLTTGPFPAAGHFDVFQLHDEAIGERKVQAMSWRMPLDGGDVEWTWETIT